ncbi:MAG: hypothetical protein IPL51_13865 [Candidatus Competibacteraceae bacterium]|nr:hypothetical protein [Candidatus Competibacteraceae bacterium]
MKDDKAMGDHLVKHGTIKSEHRETLFGRIKKLFGFGNKSFDAAKA